MCICMYVCMYVCIYICMYIYMCMFLSYNSDKIALSDICIQYSRHTAPKGGCIYIRQSTSACVITNMLHFRRSKNLEFTVQLAYIVTDANCDYGRLFYIAIDLAFVLKCLWPLLGRLLSIKVKVIVYVIYINTIIVLYIYYTVYTVYLVSKKFSKLGSNAYW